MEFEKEDSMNRMLYCTARLLWKLKADNYRWAKMIFLAVFLGIYTAEMIVMLPDWWEDMIKLWWR